MNKSHWGQKRSYPQYSTTSLHKFGAILGLQKLSVLIAHLWVWCIHISVLVLLPRVVFTYKHIQNRNSRNIGYEVWYTRTTTTAPPPQPLAPLSLNGWMQNANQKVKGEKEKEIREKKKEWNGGWNENFCRIEAVDPKTVHYGFQGDWKLCFLIFFWLLSFMGRLLFTWL